MACASAIPLILGCDASGTPSGLVESLSCVMDSLEVGTISAINWLNNPAEQLLGGAINQTVEIVVLEDAGDVILSANCEAGAGILTIHASGVEYNMNVPSSITLTKGTDIAPKLNYVFIEDPTGMGVMILTSNITGWPSTAHAPIATVLVQSSDTVATMGAYKVHAWTDHIRSITENGHLQHINRRIRQEHASWEDGCVGSFSVGGDASLEAYADIATGNVFQMHIHTMPAIDMQTPASALVVNHATAFTPVTTLTDLTVDSEATSLTGKYFNLVLWGVVSEKPGDCQLMINLPAGVYTNEVNAQNDSNNTANYTIPGNFKGTGFLIARLTLRKASGTNDWSESLNTDIRGLVPSTAVGGSTGIGEINTASNLGAGQGWFAQKAGADLEFLGVSGVNIDIDQFDSETVTLSAGPLMPPGAMMMYAASTAPTGWLMCDGTSYAEGDHAGLFAAIGATYGGGGGNFNVPDMRGMAGVGMNTDHDTAALRIVQLGVSGGSESHVLTENEMPSHSHPSSSFEDDASLEDAITSAGDSDGTPESDVTSNVTGGDAAHENMPPFLGITYIIKT